MQRAGQSAVVLVLVPFVDALELGLWCCATDWGAWRPHMSWQRNWLLFAVLPAPESHLPSMDCTSSDDKKDQWAEEVANVMERPVGHNVEANVLPSFEIDPTLKVEAVVS